MLPSARNSIVWLMALLLLCQAYAQLGPGGSSTCPCVDPWADLSLSSDICHNVTFGGSMTGCAPSNYGASICQQWDTELEWCPGPDTSAAELQVAGLSWCNSAWCYINISQCEVPHSSSAIALIGDEAPLGFAYSYETCGTLDNYGKSKHADFQIQTVGVL